MVKQIVKLRTSFTIRTRRMGSDTFGGDGGFARHRLVHPGEPDGAMTAVTLGLAIIIPTHAVIASTYFGSFLTTLRMACVVYSLNVPR